MFKNSSRKKCSKLYNTDLIRVNGIKIKKSYKLLTVLHFKSKPHRAPGKNTNTRAVDLDPNGSAFIRIRIQERKKEKCTLYSNMYLFPQNKTIHMSHNVPECGLLLEN